MKRQKTEEEYISLFDYLGRPAGDLGYEVYQKAKAEGIKPHQKKVDWSKEKNGRILTYPVSFLNKIIKDLR